MGRQQPRNHARLEIQSSLPQPFTYQAQRPRRSNLSRRRQLVSYVGQRAALTQADSKACVACVACERARLHGRRCCLADDAHAALRDDRFARRPRSRCVRSKHRDSDLESDSSDSPCDRPNLARLEVTLHTHRRPTIAPEPIPILYRERPRPGRGNTCEAPVGPFDPSAR